MYLQEAVAQAPERNNTHAHTHEHTHARTHTHTHTHARMSTHQKHTAISISCHCLQTLDACGHWHASAEGSRRSNVLYGKEQYSASVCARARACVCV